MNNPERVARLDNTNNDSRKLGCFALAELPALYDAVEQLAPGAELHHNVDVLLVLVGALDGDDVPVAREVVHDLDLAADVLDVLLGDELALGYGLAGVVHPGGEVGAEVGGAELPLPELAPERVVLAEARGRVAEHVGRQLCGGGHPALHRRCARRPRRAARGLLPVRGVVVRGGGVGGDGRVLRLMPVRRAAEAGEVLGSKRDAARVPHHVTRWAPSTRPRPVPPPSSRIYLKASPRGLAGA
uniref:Uncharacterized protein n=1 Tax=Oryza brachyantha TaxID=4533 RepID=J3LFY1_ORYBR